MQQVTSNQNSTSKQPHQKKIGVKSILLFLLLLLVMPVILFSLSGRWMWPMAWAYSIIYIGAALVSRSVLMVKTPDLLSERAQFLKGDAIKSWDKLLVPFVALLGPLFILVVAALDQRFSWSPQLSLWLKAVGLIVFFLGTLLGIWAIIVNRFFSSVVRIQKDRGHEVVTAGPYRFVRHPAYAGNLFSTVGIAIMLGSLWSFIPAIFVIIGLILRTSLEDRDLTRELEGYEAYAQQTRYRLIPGVW
jgi:protein-S-isoprenylcysteine O-methyltransferase Ste14